MGWLVAVKKYVRILTDVNVTFINLDNHGFSMLNCYNLNVFMIRTLFLKGILVGCKCL